MEMTMTLRYAGSVLPSILGTTGLGCAPSWNAAGDPSFAARPRHAGTPDAVLFAGTADATGTGVTKADAPAAPAAQRIQMNVQGIPPRGPEPV